jgi:hypothetical protein
MTLLPELENFQMFGDSIHTLLEIVLQHTGPYKDGG